MPVNLDQLNYMSVKQQRRRATRNSAVALESSILGDYSTWSTNTLHSMNSCFQLT